jgi:hypothetical protein
MAHGWDLKVLGTINMTRAFYPLMKARAAAPSSTSSATRALA